jgi:hypothetical protein
MSSASGAGFAWTIACIKSTALAPVNGRAPDNISYSTTPNEKMSLRSSNGDPEACSGDM